MRVARGLGAAFLLFAASFALHVVGGATDQGWLFALAVALIYLSAAGFPVIAAFAGGFPDVRAPAVRMTAAMGAVGGYGFTLGALWATNGRAFAWWEFPLAAALVLVVSAALRFTWRAVKARPGRPPETSPAPR